MTSVDDSREVAGAAAPLDLLLTQAAQGTVRRLSPGKPGLRFLGGQILPYRQDNAVALLSYGDDQGVRVTVYLRAGEHGNTVLRSVSLDDTVVFYWLDKRCGYVVAATTDRDRLSRIAKAVFDHFEVTQSVDKTVL